MAKNYVQEGRVLTFTAPAGGVVNGKLYKIGALHVVADGTFAAGEECEGHVVGVFSFPKVSANTPAQFDKAYLLADGSAITTAASGNTLVGVFTEAFANGDTECTVRLSGIAV